jgi:hypothetical protein
MTLTMMDDDRIRKTVGSRPPRDAEQADPIQRVYALWLRLKHLGITGHDDDERIRKVVGRSERERR